MVTTEGETADPFEPTTYLVGWASEFESPMRSNIAGESPGR
jgi:hypothetical protein